MNYERTPLLEALAAKYAVGSMRGAARARFERLCAALPAAQAARQRWEDRLLPLALTGREVSPRADSWPAIARRLAESRSGTVRTPIRVRGWRWAAVAAIVAVVVLIGRYALWQQPEWQLVATLAPANAAAQWRVERTADAHQIVIRTLQNVPAEPGRSFELWALPTGAGKPVSLGLIPPSGDAERSLTDAQRAMLLAAANLAVSVEPAGGSPTGLPTGPVIIVAPVARAG
jgi:anti-sigma-K factor RskA